MAVFFIAAVVTGSFVCLYLALLSRRLCGPQSVSNAQAFLSDVQLAKVSYDNVNMLDAIPSKPTMANYVVIGGSGYLGTYIIRLLLLRGETTIRILDLSPPHPDIALNPSVSFIQTDITSLQSVRNGLMHPFANSGSSTVIYHTAAIIRFWERAGYAWPLSHTVNVQGTANVLSVAKKLPNAVLIYTSTAEAALPCIKFLRLGWNFKTPLWRKISISDSDAPLTSSQGLQSCYARSKVLAERLVIGANGWNGLKTGIIRPGYTIIGPNDRLLTSTLEMPQVPIFDKSWSGSNICVWDAAAAHILYEDALQRIPEESAGQAFLVTGDGPAWKLRDIRNAVKYYSSRPLIFTEIPPLLVYILAHVVELFLFIRFYALLPFFALLNSRPSVTPRWLGQFVYLQPETLQYLNDLHIDDSRAREVLGYKPQWSTAQCIRYTVDEMQSGRAQKGNGLQIRYS